MLIRKKKDKTKKTDPTKTPHRGDIGSGWWAGKDGSSLWPDSAFPKFEKGTDGVTRPVRER